MIARWAAVVLLMAVLADLPARADPVAAFYRNTEVTFIVGTGAGGSHDAYARLLARHLGRFNPGKLTWLGSPASFQNDANILIVRKDAPVKSIEEARRQDLPPLVLGGSAEGGIGNDVPIILHDTIGLHVKQVVGFPDNPAIYV